MRITPIDPATVLDCGHLPTVPESVGTGVAIDDDGRTMCYPCADAATAATVAASAPGDRITLYLSSDGRSVTTWTGGVIMNRVSVGARHNWSRDRFYLSAVDVDGRTWSGTGAPGMWATLRLTKA